jgi:hypothetical protein
MRRFKIQRLLYAIVFLAFVAGFSTADAYTINGKTACGTTGRVPKGALVQAYEVDPLPGGSYTVNTPELASGAINDSGNFTLTFSWPAGGTGYEAGGPDIIYRITQNAGGSTQIIYEEKPRDAHWNQADGATSDLAVASEASVCSDPSVTVGSIPNNKLFLFTRIGTYPTTNIDCKGSSSGSTGYCQPRKAPYSFTGASSDMPFGGSLDLFAWIGKQSQIAYYKAQFSTDAGASWTDIETPLPNMWYDTTDPNPLKWHWVSESMGPFTAGGQSNLYKVPYLVRPDTPWAWLDRIAQFNTTMAKDGKCRVRILPFKANADGTVTQATSSEITIDPNYGEIVLQIDNTPPTVEILKVNSGTAACTIFNFGTSANDKLNVSFRVYDQRGHLRDYALNALYGHNQYVSVKPTTPNKAEDNYNNNATGSPSWNGSLGYSSDYIGNVQTSVLMPTCAYQLGLSASKRTTNGYGLIYNGVEDTWHLTIQRP